MAATLSERFGDARYNKRKKRTSDVVKYCVMHGKFVGYQWGGHRRTCRAGEATEEEFKASSKPAVENESRSFKVLKDLKNHLFDLDQEIERCVKSTAELKASLALVAETLYRASQEKKQVIATLKEMTK